MALSFLISFFPAGPAILPPRSCPCQRVSIYFSHPPFVWLWWPPGAQQHFRACVQCVPSSRRLESPPEAGLLTERGAFKGARPSWLLPPHPDPVGRCFCHFPIGVVGQVQRDSVFLSGFLSRGSPFSWLLPAPPLSGKPGPFMRVILKAGVCVGGSGGGQGVL